MRYRTMYIKSKKCDNAYKKEEVTMNIMKKDLEIARNNLNNVIGVEEASEKWGLSAGYIKNLCAEGKIIGKKIGKTWVIDGTQPNPRFKDSEKLTVHELINTLKRHEKVTIVYGENQDFYEGYIDSVSEKHVILHEYVSDIYRTFNRDQISEVEKKY